MQDYIPRNLINKKFISMQLFQFWKTQITPVS